MGKGFPICEKHHCTKILPHRLWNTLVTLLSVNTENLQMILCFLCWHFTQHFNFYVIRVLKHLKVFCKMSFIRSFINKNCHDAIVRRNKTTSCSVSHCRSSRYICVFQMMQHETKKEKCFTKLKLVFVQKIKWLKISVNMQFFFFFFYKCSCIAKN